MLEEKKAPPTTPPTKKHSVDMENRKKLNLTGIENVESFDEDCIIANSVMGTMQIKGTTLHINKLNTDTNELFIEGTITSIIYTNGATNKKRGFLFKMFQ